MLPPVLEIVVIHHPEDHVGADIACEIFAHFHGTTFSGLIGGAVEVYVRTEPWDKESAAPRPIPFPGAALLNGVAPARLVAVVPILSLPLTRAVQEEAPWAAYFDRVVSAQEAYPDRVGVFPVRVDSHMGSGSRLRSLLGSYQQIAVPSGLGPPEPLAELRCRDMAQGIAQLIAGPNARLQIFISHTRHTSLSEEEDAPALIRIVQEILGETRLQHFFDASDLQPGRKWDDELRSQAAKSALLALRTDLYASRAWCQCEMVLAKYAGMPVVILDALGQGEERGSFLMDHVPRIPIREANGEWNKADIRRGLNLLVDECLKRALWGIQHDLAADSQDLEISWWAPHAPEPVTLTRWLHHCADEGSPVLGDENIRILHPDPPLGPEEIDALQEIANVMGHRGLIDVMTPRTLSARGG